MSRDELMTIAEHWVTKKYVEGEVREKAFYS